MTHNVRELFDRIEAEKAGKVQEEAVRLHERAQSRRRRREQRKARLRFVPTATGGTLFVPNTLPLRGFMILGIAAAIGFEVTRVAALLEKAPLTNYDYVWLVLLVSGSLFVCHFFTSFFATRRIEVLKGRGYVVRRRTIFGFLMVVEAEKDPDVRIEVAESGLFEGSWGTERVLSLGKADVDVLKQACASAEIPLRLPSPEAIDRADRWVGRGIERYVLQMILGMFVVIGGVLALMYFSIEDKYEAYTAPDLSETAVLDGLFRSHSVKDWGTAWAVKPSKMSWGSSRGFRGFAIEFPDDSPVKELRTKMTDEENQSGRYLEVYLANRAEPYVIYESSCENYSIKGGACLNADGTLDSELRAYGELRFACVEHKIDGTLFANCPKTDATTATKPAPPARVSGQVESRNREFGRWKATAETCSVLNEGMKFGFSKGSTLKELRVAGGKDPAWVELEVGGKTHRVQRSECERIWVVDYTNPPGANAREGELHLQCPRERLDGSIFFKGCTSQR